MKVISISTDNKLFDEKSSVRNRQMEYASKTEAFHIIIFSLKEVRLKEIHQGSLHIYPTNSGNKLRFISDAVRIAKQIVLKNGLNKGDFVVSTQDPFETGLVGKKLKRFFGVSLQVQIHTDFLSPYFKNSFLNRLRVKIANFVIPKADSLRVVSSVISDSVKNKFPNLKAKIDILPIFVDTDALSQELDENKSIKKLYPQFDNVIFMNSRLSKEKKIDVAMETFKKVLLKFPKTGLVIGGSGPEKNNLENLSKSLGLSNSMVFKGWTQSLYDLGCLYKTADIFLLTSEFEGYGMTLVEAGASGCPIVTTNVGLAKTSLFKNGENAFVCPVGDVNCLVKSITDLIIDQEKRNSFSNNMRDSIKSITISREVYVKKYVDLLEGLLKK